MRILDGSDIKWRRRAAADLGFVPGMVPVTVVPLVAMIDRGPDGGLWCGVYKWSKSSVGGWLYSQNPVLG